MAQKDKIDDPEKRGVQVDEEQEEEDSEDEETGKKVRWDAGVV
jgi:hypothetical protein